MKVGQLGQPWMLAVAFSRSGTRVGESVRRHPTVGLASITPKLTASPSIVPCGGSPRTPQTSADRSPRRGYPAGRMVRANPRACRGPMVPPMDVSWRPETRSVPAHRHRSNRACPRTCRAGHVYSHPGGGMLAGWHRYRRTCRSRRPRWHSSQPAGRARVAARCHPERALRDRVGDLGLHRASPWSHDRDITRIRSHPPDGSYPGALLLAGECEPWRIAGPRPCRGGSAGNDPLARAKDSRLDNCGHGSYSVVPVPHGTHTTRAGASRWRTSGMSHDGQE